MTERVTPGQKLATTPLRRASVLNDLLAATDFWKGQEMGTPRSPRRMMRSHDVAVRNSSGGNLSRGACLQLGADILDQIYPDNCWQVADVPAVPLHKCVILAEPIPDGEIGAAFASGECPAKVNVLHASHAFATPVAGSTVLNSAPVGMFEILSTVPGTGNHELWVRFQQSGSQLVSIQSASAGTTLTGTIGTAMPIDGVGDPLPSWLSINASHEILLSDEVVGCYLQFSGSFAISADKFIRTGSNSARVDLATWDNAAPGYATLWAEQIYFANDLRDYLHSRCPSASWGPIKSGDKFQVQAYQLSGADSLGFGVGSIHNRLDIELTSIGMGYGTRRNV